MPYVHISLSSSNHNLLDELTSISKRVGTKILTQMPNTPEIIISVGETDLKANFVVKINSNGWVAFMSCNEKIMQVVNPLQNPIGAIGAACFGTSEVFKRLLELAGSKRNMITKHASQFVFSFLDYSCTDNNAKLPFEMTLKEKILLVGAGAVGSGFVYALSSIENLSSNMVIVDPDRFDTTNLNRCPIAFVENIGEEKAIVASRYATSNLAINPEVINYKDYVKKNGNNHPIVISTVDNNETRIQIQSDMPKFLYHGATGDHIATIAKIDFLRTACLGCIFNNTESYYQRISRETGISESEIKNLFENDGVLTDKHIQMLKIKLGTQAEQFISSVGQSFKNVYVKEMCGTINIQSSTHQHAATVSFVSMIVGLMLAGEIVKSIIFDSQRFPISSENNYLSVSLFSPCAFLLVNRLKHDKCLCLCQHNSMKKRFEKKWGYEKKI